MRQPGAWDGRGEAARGAEAKETAFRQHDEAPERESGCGRKARGEAGDNAGRETPLTRSSTPAGLRDSLDESDPMGEPVCGREGGRGREPFPTHNRGARGRTVRSDGPLGGRRQKTVGCTFRLRSNAEESAIACARLLTLSLRRTALTCALMVASDTPIS